jgi:phosphatidylinositol alpha-1,6-mannosyltransferase
VPRTWYETLIGAGRKRAGTAKGTISIVTAFRMEAWRSKGLATLLEAIESLDDPRIRLTVCGSGQVPAALAGLAEGRDWCRLVTNPSPGRLAARLAAADVVVLATATGTGGRRWGEGFGLVLLEAQLAGTVVVGPAYGGGRDAYVHGVTGLTPADDSPAALARVLAELIGDDERRAAMGAAAANWAKTRFDPDRHAGDVMQSLFGRSVTAEEARVLVEAP